MMLRSTVLFPLLIALGCGDTTGPKEPEIWGIYDLIYVNADIVPATIVNGQCSEVEFPNINIFRPPKMHPDTQEVSSGRLVLGGALRRADHFSLEYKYRGKTSACTVLGWTWKERYEGSFWLLDDRRLLFQPDSAYPFEGQFMPPKIVTVQGVTKDPSHVFRFLRIQ